VIELGDRKILKRIEKGDSNDMIKAVSYNTGHEYKYDTIDIPKSKINNINSVLIKLDPKRSY